MADPNQTGRERDPAAPEGEAGDGLKSAPVVPPAERVGPPRRPAQHGQPGREPEKVAEAEEHRAAGIAADQQATPDGGPDDGDDAGPFGDDEPGDPMPPR